MRIAIDATPMIGGEGHVRTGIGQLVASLMDALPPLASADGVEVAPYALTWRGRNAIDQLPASTRRVPFPAHLMVRLWASVDAPRIDRRLGNPDVIHVTNFRTPPTHARLVIWAHDLAFLRDPGLATSDTIAAGRTLRRAARRGALFVAATTVTADDVRELLGSEFDNGTDVAVVPFARPDLPPPSPNRVGPDGLYVLALGTCEPRKNLPRLVAAFGDIAIKQPDVSLVLAGPDGSDRANVDAAIAALTPNARDRVMELGPVSDPDRVALLRDATVLAYPSIYEGFGIPALEAMACGVPVVAGAVGSIPEVAGDAALLVDPLDCDAIADGLLRVLDDAHLASELVARGLTRQARFTPEAMARGFLDCYHRVLA